MLPRHQTELIQVNDFGVEEHLFDALPHQIADGRSVGILQIGGAGVGEVHLNVDDSLVGLVARWLHERLLSRQKLVKKIRKTIKFSKQTVLMPQTADEVPNLTNAEPLAVEMQSSVDKFRC